MLIWILSKKQKKDLIEILVNRIFVFILFLFFLAGCSLNENSRIWNKEVKTISKNKKKVFVEEKKLVKELNPSLKLNLSKIKHNNKIDYDLNNFGSLTYNGNLSKVGKYNFSKFDNFNEINFEPLILNDGVIVFDKKGNILRFNNNQKIIWKSNFYSKSEKKLNLMLTFAKTGNSLLAADNISRIFSIEINSGKLIWSKKSDYPFNSEIKIYKDKFFVVDYKNILRCFYINDGSECWRVKTEESFTVSESKYSIIIQDNILIFNNSIGDITAIDILSGLIKWQLPTQKSNMTNEAYSFNYSKLVSDGNTIYFSNNKNEFYSIDLKSGIINWVIQINSILSPILIGDYIFTVSNTGHFVTIEKKRGNIIRINDIYKNYKPKKKKNLKPTGFMIAQNKLFLSNSDGNLIIVEVNSGKISRNERISRSLISKPYFFNGNLFIVKNGSVIQYD